jgi:peptidylprolyl isomerase
MPPPFSQGWVANIRTLARAHWWDKTSVNRVQDNYVVQWGDAGYDNPESGDLVQKPLPDGLIEVPAAQYTVAMDGGLPGDRLPVSGARITIQRSLDPYGIGAFAAGWPIALDSESGDRLWPVHCYGMVGVGRNLAPDTGTGAELYTVIGHAPRHLDKNIALVGRVIEGMEHLSSLPRGRGALGFYEDPERRVPIRAVRLASDLPEAQRPQFAYLSTDGETFAAYADARSNRRDPFFNEPAGGTDICNIPVPIRRVP